MNLSPLPIQKFFDNDGRPLSGGKLFTYAAGTTTKRSTYTDALGSVTNSNPIILNFRGEARVWIDPTLAYKFTLSPSTDTDPPTNPIWTVDNITASPSVVDNAALDTGSGNSIQLAITTLSSTPAIFDRIVWKSAIQNTGAVTISINGGPAKSLVWQNRQSLDAGAIQVNGMYEAIYDNTTWQLQGPTLNPREQLTVDEFVAGVSPSAYSFLPGDANRFGASPTASAAVNAQAINDALLSSKFVFCTTPGTYSISSVINVQSNQTIFLSQGVTLQASVRTWAGSFISVNGKSNVRWYGGVIDGNKANNVAGQVGNVVILDSSDVVFDGVRSINAPSDNTTLGVLADGFYIGGNNAAGSTDITITNCTADGNVRQGISIVRGSRIKITSNSLINTTGNNPGAGIDCEANNVSNTLRDITITGNVIYGNHYGVVLTNATKYVTVSGNTITDNRFAAVYLADCQHAVVSGNCIKSGINTGSTPIIEVLSAQNYIISDNTIHGSGITASSEGAGIRLLGLCDNGKITGNMVYNTRTQGMVIGSGTQTADFSNITVQDNSFIDCVDPSFPGTVVVGITGNSGSGFYPRLVNVTNNQFIDNRTGGNEVDFVFSLVNLPAAVVALYRMVPNYIQGPANVISTSVDLPLCGRVAFNPGGLADGAGATSGAITVTGAALSGTTGTDEVVVYPPYDTQGCLVHGYVTAANTVAIRVQNETGALVTLANGTWRVRVSKQEQM